MLAKCGYLVFMCILSRANPTEAFLSATAGVGPLFVRSFKLKVHQESSHLDRKSLTADTETTTTATTSISVSKQQPSRRDAVISLITTTLTTTVTMTSLAIVDLTSITFHQLMVAPAHAKLDPDQAYLNLRAAREELVLAGRKYFPKRDWDGLRDYLDNQAVNMNNYETNAQALLESKRLDAESKKEIGTIRRYGVGADVMIMYGGLKAEISESNDAINYRESEKYYVRTLDALEEVIAIVRSNKGFKSLEQS